MAESPTRVHLRRELEAHLTRLGYSSSRVTQAGPTAPEIVRRNPVRGRTVYGETVLHADLQSQRCHERLLRFSQRRTRHRSSILFFIAVAADDERELQALLEQLEIRNGTRGGHVHVVPIQPPAPTRKRTTAAGGRR